MIDIAYLGNIKLVSVPKVQKLIGRFFLTPNYNFFAKVEIQIEGIEKIPRNKNVIFAMNHTDSTTTGLFSINCGRQKTSRLLPSGLKGNITGMLRWQKFLTRAI